LDGGDLAANISHNTGEFMAHDEACRAWLMATEDMQFPDFYISYLLHLPEGILMRPTIRIALCK
jgi:hypothetical protein